MKPLGLSRLLGAGAIAALGFAPAPVTAQLPSEWVGQWELEASGPGICAARRIYAGGTRFVFFGHPDGTRSLLLSNSGWPKPSGGPYKLVSLRGRERLELDRSDSSADGLILGIGADLGNRVAASDAIEVVRPDGSVVEKVDLSGIAAAEARLPGCMARSAKHPWTLMPPPPAPPAPPAPPPGWMGLGRPGLERPAHAKFPIGALFSDADYPLAAIRAGEQGSVTFRISVGTSGQVTGCAITASSGSESLDSATCRLLAARAIFWPARDRLGKPTPGSVAGRIVWQLPPDEPPPPPPPS